MREERHAWQGRGVPAPSQLDVHSVPSAWILTPTSALAANMEQQAGPPEPRPAGSTTHPQPKVSHNGWDHMSPSPSPAHGASSLVWGSWPGLTLLYCALSQEGTLWGLLAILSLLAGLAAGTLRTPHCNETLDTVHMPQSMATTSPAVEEGVEVPLTAAWSQLYGVCWGRNATLGWGPQCHAQGPLHGQKCGHRWDVSHCGEPQPVWGCLCASGPGAGGGLNTRDPVICTAGSGRALGTRRRSASHLLHHPVGIQPVP